MKKILNIIDSRSTILFKRKTGVQSEKAYYANGLKYESVVYKNVREITREDIVTIQQVFTKRTKKILRWLKRPNYRLVGIKVDGRMAHFCIVVICIKSACFGLATKDDLIIMNCNTLAQFRGMGLYKINLDNICLYWKPEHWAFINTSSIENNSSRRGIEGAGFERLGIFKQISLSRLMIYSRRIGD